MNRPPGAALALMRACLATAEQPRTATWTELGQLRDALRIRAVRDAGLLAQVHHSATLAGAALDPGLRSVLRAARVHEDLRMATIVPAIGAALSPDAIVLRGVALAYTVYDDPVLRHCHDLDLLVESGSGIEAHPSGFPIARHGSLLADRQIGPDAVDTVPATVAGVATRVLAPADALVHLCVHAATLGTPGSPRWAVDAALLIRRHAPLDWERVAVLARGWACTRPVMAALRWLERELDVGVPRAALSRRFAWRH